ncbi:MAG TPA: pyridoxamine 5'-phosphate oxidase [Bacteroidia bacterium]|jgi:pyridoxamine 5'-phosphate oxidase|nr:pyridoxamine 5'-phosphate oxidase [Bacteroidia bacterium]
MEEVNEHLRKIRTDYSKASLDEGKVADDPFKQFGEWFLEAIDAEVTEVNAMTLATSDEHNRPSARIVLLRDFSAAGFSFFTNYRSEKGHALEVNPNACLNFFWPELQRQVRINGKVKKLSAKESDEYFHSRPQESRIGAWSSPQSEIIPGRKWLEDQVAANKIKFNGQEIARPEWWGGYILEPDSVEFWQGRESRLHDRIIFRLSNGNWNKKRLAP